ncbi:MAG: DNA primase [Acidimicrobiales bacterium]
MGILDEDVARVREATDIVAVVSEHTQLRRVGRRFVGLCPFHAERTGSFSVNAEEGLYYCFGCQASGDAITFVREVEHLDFAAAVERLAAKAGVSLRYTDRNEGEHRRRRGRIIEALGRAAAFYHERLLTAPDAGPARGYVRSRGIGGDEVRRFQLGWAPDGWDELARRLRLPDDLLKDTGLGFLNRRGRQQDFFRARVMFPIFDPQGDVVSFGGRILPGGQGGKYVNLTETPVYSKSKTLYGLNWAKNPIVEADEAVVCEGYTDVIGFHHAGVPRAVATCGTALTEDHVRLLTRFARRIVLAFDADAAGQAAAARFYEWERKYAITVKVAVLPDGVDPGDLARRDPAALAAAVSGAQPFLGFRVERALAAADVASPEGRARAAKAALSMVAEHPDDLVRDQYVVRIAERCRLEADQLRRMASGAPQRLPRGALVALDRPRDAVHRRDDAERDALRVAVAAVDDAVDWFDEVLFADPVNARAFAALAQAGTLLGALDAADAEAADVLRQAAQEETAASAQECFVRLCQEAHRRAKRQIEAQSRNGGDPLKLNRQMAELSASGAALDDADGSLDSKLDAGARLLTWLLEQAEDRA